MTSVNVDGLVVSPVYQYSTYREVGTREPNVKWEGNKEATIWKIKNLYCY